MSALAARETRIPGTSTITGSRRDRSRNPSMRRTFRTDNRMYNGYRVVKVFIGLVTPSLLPLESSDSTV
jgi:hypothetical protein